MRSTALPREEIHLSTSEIFNNKSLAATLGSLLSPRREPMENVVWRVALEELYFGRPEPVELVGSPGS